MSRVLNLKKGDKCIVAREWTGRTVRDGYTRLDNVEEWTWEVEVMTVSKQYITVDFRGTKEKFQIDFDYQQKVNRGGSDYKLYVTREEVLDRIKVNKLHDKIKSKFDGYGNTKYTLEQLERIMSIINENEVVNNYE